MSRLNSLSAREQALLRVTLVIVGLALLASTFILGYSRLNTMDREIANAELEVVNLYTQHLHQDSVDKAYARVISSHATAQSKEEIHDSLRREIYRLALKKPNAPATNAKLSNNNKYLLQIPELKEGLFHEKGKGYQEYQVRFRVPSAPLPIALEYIKRLENSSLLLRIDSLEISRSHTSADLVGMDIEITRTVLSEIDSGEAL